MTIVAPKKPQINPAKLAAFEQDAPPVMAPAAAAPIAQPVQPIGRGRQSADALIPITMKITQADLEKIEAAAAEARTNRSAFMRKVLMDHIEGRS